jgi:hypothetical protein
MGRIPLRIVILILRFIRLAGAACGFMQSGSCASAVACGRQPKVWQPAKRGAYSVAGEGFATVFELPGQDMLTPQA